MKQNVTRPQDEGKRISCYKEFELCYLRHQYLRKTTTNPSEEEMAPFHGIILSHARKTYFMYSGLFQSSGMECDDIINIGRTHLVSFLGLYSVMKPDRLEKFGKHFIDTMGCIPTEKDLLDKDKADFTLFLKQRMEDLVRVCRQKVRNIRGQLAEEFLVFYGDKLPPEDHFDMPKKYLKMGYKKLSVGKFKNLKKQFNVTDEGPIYLINKKYYIVIPLDHRNLTLEDLEGAGLNPYDALHNMNPEELLLKYSNEDEFQRKKRKWYKSAKDVRNKKIRNFIRAKANDPRYTEEIKTARKLITE